MATDWVPADATRREQLLAAGALLKAGEYSVFYPRVRGLVDLVAAREDRSQRTVWLTCLREREQVSPELRRWANHHPLFVVRPGLWDDLVRQVVPEIHRDPLKKEMLRAMISWTVAFDRAKRRSKRCPTPTSIPTSSSTSSPS